MKNNLFNVQRYLYMLRVEWVENWQSKLLYRLAVPFLVYFCVTSFIFWIGCLNFSGASTTLYEDSMTYIHKTGWEEVLFGLNLCTAWLFVFYSVLLSSQITTQLTRKKDRIRLLMLPATTLEKYLVMLKTWGACVLLLFPIIVISSDALRGGLFSVFFPDLPIPFGGYLDFLGTPSAAIFSSWDEVGWFSIGVLLLSSIYAFGATLWTKLSIVKTTFALFAIGGLTVWFVVTATNYLFPEEGLYNVLGVVFRKHEWLRELWIYRSILLGISGMFYLLAYFRLRESDLLNRW